MSVAASSQDVSSFVVEKVPETNAMESPEVKQKKKKKKEKGVNIEDMYSFDLSELEKPKPARKPKEQTDPNQISMKELERTMKMMARIVGKEEVPAEKEAVHQEEVEHSTMEAKEPKVMSEDVKAPSPSHLRFPSPSRTRRAEAESPKKTSTPLKASAAEFVPPGFSSPPKATSTLKASAAQFIPPGFEPELVPKVAERICDVEEKAPSISTFAQPQSESSTTSCWAHAVLTPACSVSSSLKSAEQEPTEIAQTLNPWEPSLFGAPEPAKAVAGSDQTNLCGASLDVGSILGKVKMSLTSTLTRLAPISVLDGAAPAGNAEDPSLGRVQEKIQKIEEAEMEAEKRKTAADEARAARLKESQREMDETMMDCFLQAVTTRVKDRDLPIMGTALYGKHMRSCRRIGTSCDAKDSSYVYLRPFLESLEDEELLELKKDVKDPTVIWINRNHPFVKQWRPWAYSDTVGVHKSGPRR